MSIETGPGINGSKYWLTDDTRKNALLVHSSSSQPIRYRDFVRFLNINEDIFVVYEANQSLAHGQSYTKRVTMPGSIYTITVHSLYSEGGGGPSSFTNTVTAGNEIAVHTAGDGTVTPIYETVTDLLPITVDSTDPQNPIVTLSYLDEAGVTQTENFTFNIPNPVSVVNSIDLKAGTNPNELTVEITYTDDAGTTQTIVDTTPFDLSDLHSEVTQVVTAGNIIATHEANSVTTNILETVTTLVDNGDCTLTYTSEDATLTTFNEGLYLGELGSIADLTALATASLDKPYQYFVDGCQYIWDADATEGAYQPDDVPAGGNSITISNAGNNAIFPFENDGTVMTAVNNPFELYVGFPGAGTVIASITIAVGDTPAIISAKLDAAAGVSGFVFSFVSPIEYLLITPSDFGIDNVSLLGGVLMSITSTPAPAPGFWIEFCPQVLDSPWNNPDGSAADQTSGDINYVEGRVGVGTATPSARLQVEGKNPAVAVNNGSPRILLNVDINNNPSIELHRGSVAGDQAGALFFDWAYTNGTDYDARFAMFQSSVFRFMSFPGRTLHYSFVNEGNVGIGTLSPSHRLDIDGEDALRMRDYPDLRDDTGTFTPVNFLYTDDDGCVLSAPLDAASKDSPWDNPDTTPADQSSTNIQYSEGHVSAGEEGTGQVSLTINDGGGNANIAFNHKGTVPDRSGTSGRISVDVDLPDGDMVFSLEPNVTSGVATAATERMRITDGVNNEATVIISSYDKSGLHINSSEEDKSLLTLRRTSDNSDEIGIAFQNNGGLHVGTIYVTDQLMTDTRWRDSITIASIVGDIDPDLVGDTATFGYLGQVKFHEYGIGNFDDTHTRLLGVQADGAIVEVQSDVKAIKEISGNYAALDQDYTLVQTVAGSTVTLPAASTVIGRIYEIKNLSGGDISLGGGSDLIDYSTSHTLADRVSLRVQALKPGQWIII